MMDEQTEKMNLEASKKHSETNEENKKEEKNKTNLQTDSEGSSEKFMQSDNVSDEKDDKKEEEKQPEQPKEPTIEEKYAALNDSYLRLMAEFDNFRKRTIREKADLIKNGSAAALTNLLPVIDDFERALKTMQSTENIDKTLIEGVELIYDKFISYLSHQGVKSIEAIGQPFDTEFFEAIATIPSPEADKKGKVVDCVQTGYMLYDKVLRHAKVVVGG